MLVHVLRVQFTDFGTSAASGVVAFMGQIGGTVGEIVLVVIALLRAASPPVLNGVLEPSKCCFDGHSHVQSLDLVDIETGTVGFEDGTGNVCVLDDLVRLFGCYLFVVDSGLPN